MTPKNSGSRGGPWRETAVAEDEGVLKRWHRRKTAAREEPTIEAQEAPEDLPVAADSEQTPTEEAPPPDLPDIDTLDADSDFSVFMADGVPEDIRRLALRKLWRLDPVLANVDGLVDYGEDFTDSAMVVEGMKTAYRLSKGWLDDEDEEQTDPEGETVADASTQSDPSDHADDQQVEDEEETASSSLSTDDDSDPA